MVITKKIKLNTKGNTDIIDITNQVTGILSKTTLNNGVVTVFVSGSTGALSTVEYEPGLVQDLKEMFEKIAPENQRYEHEETWHDDNGHSHVRASLLGPSLVVPVVGGALTLGTWQQIILVDFDTRARTRTVVCQMVGE